jgi:hypothetical protein
VSREALETIAPGFEASPRGWRGQEHDRTGCARDLLDFQVLLNRGLRTSAANRWNRHVLTLMWPNLSCASLVQKQLYSFFDELRSYTIPIRPGHRLSDPRLFEAASIGTTQFYILPASKADGALPHEHRQNQSAGQTL